MADCIEQASERNPSSQCRDDEFSAEVIILNARRRRALEQIDNAYFSWAHAKICFVAGMGFFTDAYDVFAISIMVSMLGYVWGDENGDLSPWQSTGLKVASPVGSLFGQIIFGFLADILGRRRMYGIVLVIMVTATFGQALAGSGSAINVVTVLILWRFIMGVGCGGDYPVSAIIMSEFSPIRIRGRLMTAVFAAQGWGQLAACLVGLVVVVAYKDAILNAEYPSTDPVDCTWRLLVGFGCVPGLIAYCCRITIPETPRFTMDIQRNITHANSDINQVLSDGRYSVSMGDDEEQLVAARRASIADFTRHFSKWGNLKVLIGTAYSWFAFGVPFYTLALNSSAVLTYSNLGKINGNSSVDVYESLFRICSGNTMLTVAGFIPGFWASFIFIDSWGRKPIQLMGFLVLTLLFLAMAFAYIPLNATVAGQRAFISLYCLANFFQTFGPHTTTFIIPGEVFPTRYRATAHGISAACGKLGAIVAQLVFGLQLLNNVKDMQLILEGLSFIMFTGVLSTLLVPETKQHALEKLSNERQDSYITGVFKRGVPPPPQP